MKVGSGSIGYTSGALYKRHQRIGYTPGSHYKRFGNLGLPQQRNMKEINRQAVESTISAIETAGPQIFNAKLTESEGLSEIAAKQVLQRVQQAMNALADTAASVSLANGGTGGSVDETA